MFKSSCIFLCLCYFVVGSYGSDSLVPFIDKCEWSDKGCLLASTKKALPYVCKGLSQLGIEPLDHLKMAKATFKEAGLKVDFTNMDVTNLCKCNILKVERYIEKNKLRLEAECPIDVVGHYDCVGNLLSVPIEGKGPFHVSCESMFIAVEVGLTTVVGQDGVKYWKVGKATHSFEARKPGVIHFENLFNGDKDKAEPVTKLFNDNSKEILNTFGKPIVDEALNSIVDIFGKVCSKVPADQLEK